MVKEAIYPLHQHGHVECIHTVQELFQRKEKSQVVSPGIVKQLLKNAKETPRGVLEILEPANSPLQLVEKQFLGKNSSTWRM